MFVLEPVGARPPSIKSSYCFCVRHPYVVGRLDTSDLVVDTKTVSRQHASLHVRNRAEVPEPIARARAQAENGEEETESTPPTSFSHRLPSPESTPSRSVEKEAAEAVVSFPSSPIVLEVTNHSKFGTEVNGEIISGSRILEHGSIVGFGGVQFLVSYRPVTVVVNSDCYDAEYRADLSEMLRQLGAEVLDAVQDRNSADPRRIAAFFVSEMINTSKDVVDALTHDVSIVSPTYLFEMYASLAENPVEPLHTLPHPADFEPSTDRVCFGVAQYVRPEPRTVALSLFPNSVDQHRSRKTLLSRRAFTIHDARLKALLGSRIESCGGTLIPFEGVYAVALEEQRFCEGEADSSDDDEPLDEVKRAERERKRQLRERVERRREVLAQFQHLRYAVVSDEELEVLRQDVDPPSVLTDFDEAVAAENAANERDTWRIVGSHGWVIINQQSILQALLSNKFVPVPIHIEQAVFQGEEDKGIDLSETDSEHQKTEIDSDATPSELGSERSLEDVAGMSQSKRRDYELMTQTSSSRSLEIRLHRLRTSMDRSIAVCEFQVKKLHDGVVLRSDKLTKESVAFLENVSQKLHKQIADIEALNADAPEETSLSLSLRQMWDDCTRMLDKATEALAKGQKLKRVVDDSAANTVFRGLTTKQDTHRIEADRSENDAMSSAADSLSTTRNATLQYNQPPAKTPVLRDSTRWARYFPPAPVRSRAPALHEPHGGVGTTTSQTKAHQALLINIPPKDLNGIARHRRTFARRYGETEGDIRFHMWLSSQTPQWTTQFQGALEEKEFTMAQLFQLSI